LERRKYRNRLMFDDAGYRALLFAAECAICGAISA